MHVNNSIFVLKPRHIEIRFNLSEHPNFKNRFSLAMYLCVSIKIKLRYTSRYDEKKNNKNRTIDQNHEFHVYTTKSEKTQHFSNVNFSRLLQSSWFPEFSKIFFKSKIEFYPFINNHLNYKTFPLFNRQILIYGEEIRSVLRYLYAQSSFYTPDKNVNGF